MFGELGKQAYNALRHNRRRSFLTMLGMAWGIATVVLLLAYGSGFQRGLMVAFRTFGGNLIAIFPGRTSLQAGGSKAGTEIKLTMDDLEYLRAEVPAIQRMSPEVDKQSVVAYGTRSASYNIRGTYSSYQKVRNVEVAEGSFFGEREDFTHSRVAVLGYDVKKKLFSGQNALGESVRIDGISYQVIGVLNHMIQDGDDNMNGMVYVPFSAMSDLKNTGASASGCLPIIRSATAASPGATGRRSRKSSPPRGSASRRAMPALRACASRRCWRSASRPSRSDCPTPVVSSAIHPATMRPG